MVRTFAALAVLFAPWLGATGRPTPAQPFSPVGTYAISMRGVRDTTPIRAELIIADSAGALRGTYRNTAGTLMRRVLAVVVQPGPQFIVQIDRHPDISTLLLRVRGADVNGEGEFDGERFVVTGRKN